jgi:hypothetical protein
LTRIFSRLIEIIEKVVNIDDININSNYFSLPLRHYKQRLGQETIFKWDLIPNNRTKTILVRITVDKHTLADNDEAKISVEDTIQNNETFREFLESLNDFEPNNSTIEDMYNLDTYGKKETKDTITYLKRIQLGA